LLKALDISNKISKYDKRRGYDKNGPAKATVSLQRGVCLSMPWPHPPGFKIIEDLQVALIPAQGYREGIFVTPFETNKLFQSQAKRQGPLCLRSIATR
jgi:hypothetical protein